MVTRLEHALNQTRPNLSGDVRVPSQLGVAYASVGRDAISSRTMKMLHRFIAFLCILGLVGFAPQSFAKAYYAPLNEMIRYSEFIAIVEISRVEKTATKSKPFDYSEIAHATVQKNIKGILPKSIKLHGGESFICAQVHYNVGRYLVFLKRDEGLLVGCNWHLSVRPITNQQIEWYGPDHVLDLSWQPMDAVLELIKNSAGKPKVK